jgi:microcystin-dependent protein
MGDYYVGQILMAGFGFAPRYFAGCDGQILPINQNQALFSLLGTSYGGDGRTTFALPDLRGRTPAGTSATYPLGLRGGEAQVQLGIQHLPPHGHGLQATNATGGRNPNNALYGATATPIYGEAGGDQVALAAFTLSGGGDGQAHENMQPYAALNFCIALQGLYPSRN